MQVLSFLSGYEQHHLCSPRNLVMHKIGPDTLTAGIIKNNFKGTMERFVGRDNTFSFVCSVKKKHQHTGKSEKVFISCTSHG